MTDSTKREKGPSRSKGKKLQLNKETIKDLTAKGGDQVKGGVPEKTAKWSCDEPGC